MELKIEHPTKERLIEVLEAILTGELTRGKVREWVDRVSNHFQYIYGPPLKVGEGHYTWLTMEYLRDELADFWMSPGVKQHIIRDIDIELMIKDLKKEHYTYKVSEELEEFNCHHFSGDKFKEYYGNPPNSVMTIKSIKKGNPFYKLGLKFSRMVFDNMHDLREFTSFKYKDVYFCIEMCVETFNPYKVIIYGKNSSWKELVVLLEMMNVTCEDIEWINDDLKGGSYLIRRMDDNGIEFDVETFDDPITASLKLNEYEGGIHKQTYWMEEKS